MNNNTLTFFKWIFFTAVLPYAGELLFILPSQPGGFNWSGFAWLTILLVSLIRLLGHFSAVTLPAWVWLPWIVYITIRCITAFSLPGLQSTLQYMVFPLVGMAASTFTYSDITILAIKKWFTVYLLLLSVGLILSQAGLGPNFGGASTIMTIVTAGAILLSDFWVFGNSKALLLMAILGIFPMLAVSRMGMLMFLCVAALHFANKNNLSRFAMYCLIACIGAVIFYSGGFQKKTFFSGKGEIGNLSLNNEDLNTNGRTRMWALAEKGIREHPWFGVGPRADLTMLASNRYTLKELHNDYVAVRYNSGWIGLACLIFGFFMQFLLLKLRSRDISDAYTALLAYAALTLFIAWIGFMYSDNVLKYSPYFGNFHFCLIGMVYSRLNRGYPELLKQLEV